MKWLLMVVIIFFVSKNTYAAEDLHEDAAVLQKKCLVELRYQFVPKNCFYWIQKSNFNAQKKSFLRDWFNTVCKKSVQKDESIVQYHVQHLAVLSSECQKDLEVAFEQWSYKSKVEAPEKILQLMSGRADNVGRDIEYRDSHDMEKTKSHRNFGSARRRLN